MKAFDISLIVPEGAVSSTITFSCKTYLDCRFMPSFDYQTEAVLSPVVHLSSSQPQPREFLQPLQLSLPLEVPLQADSRGSGWLLVLKRSDSLYDELPGDWSTVLRFNTETGEVVSRSQFVQFDKESGALRLNHFSFYTWVGWWLGFRSQRNIYYTVFGKQVHRKWCIAVYVIHGSESVYNSLVDKLKKDQYIELCRPNTSCIEYYGKVHLKVICKEPWKIHLGDDTSIIETGDIWGCRKDYPCYREVTIAHFSSSADSVECTVKAHFQPEGSEETTHPLELVICHALRDPIDVTPPLEGPLLHMQYWSLSCSCLLSSRHKTTSSR